MCCRQFQQKNEHRALPQENLGLPNPQRRCPSNAQIKEARVARPLSPVATASAAQEDDTKEEVHP